MKIIPSVILFAAVSANCMATVAAIQFAVSANCMAATVADSTVHNMSVDCDCDSHPADPKLKDMGILASTDPVALDQACLNLVFNHKAQPGDDEKPLIERINRQHGTYITDYAEKIGLGSKKYKIVMVK